MSIRTFIILLLALALVGGLVVANKRRHVAELAAPGPSEEMLLPPARLNDIARFTVAVGAQTMTVSRAENQWVVESLWNYPANFDVVADNLRTLADTKCGEVIHGGTERLDDFGLNPATTNTGLLLPAILTFYDAHGAQIRRIGMGNPRLPKPTGRRPPFPESAFVQLDDGDVRLIAAYLPGIPRSDDGWIDRTVTTLPTEDVDEVSVTPTGGAPYRISRNVDGTFTSDSLTENESINQDMAGSVAGALSHLSLITIAAPTMDPEACGLSAASVYRARTRDGIVYTVKVGRPDTIL